MIKCNTLAELWKYVDDVNAKHFPENELRPILGAGKTKNPKIMFVLINPTIGNISSHPTWTGPRFPFIGRKHHWRVMHQAGFLDDKIMEHIEHATTWSPTFAEAVGKEMERQNIYTTNIVKWTGHDGSLPEKEKIALFLPILKREIELVQPEYIVTFGLIPFEALTNKTIRLRDYYTEAMKTKRLRTYPCASGDVIPCYFPVGRGDPKKAVEILKLVRNI
ncbi:MAG: hypothetical protein KKA90_03855 [Nanoarchaeota archaeon]|nr:hypothetical protein [Nanoarchaeota archaeon]